MERKRQSQKSANTSREVRHEQAEARPRRPRKPTSWGAVEDLPDRSHDGRQGPRTAPGDRADHRGADVVVVAGGQNQKLRGQKMEILHRYTNACLWNGEAETMREAVEKAVKEDANLRGANLEDANLGGANLEDANLRGRQPRGRQPRGRQPRGRQPRGRQNLQGTPDWLDRLAKRQPRRLVHG